MSTVEERHCEAYRALGEKEKFCFEVLCEASTVVLGTLLWSYLRGRCWSDALGSVDLFCEYASERDGSGFTRYECLLLDVLPEADMEILVPSEERGIDPPIKTATRFLECLSDAQDNVGDPQLASRFRRDYEYWFATRAAAMPVARGRPNRGRLEPVGAPDLARDAI